MGANYHLRDRCQAKNNLSRIFRKSLTGCRGEADRGRGVWDRIEVAIRFWILAGRLLAAAAGFDAADTALPAAAARGGAACPLHRGDGHGRTFGVNLDDNAFHCSG